MRLKSLRLKNFRNYRDLFVEFGSELNEIIGNNGQGKSNLLEALYLLITGKSFRTQHLKELIFFGENHFFIEISFEKHGISQTLRMVFDGKERHLFHNATAMTCRAHLLGLLQGVLLCPQDHFLIAGSPSLRRRYLDLHLAQIDPLYVLHLSRYQRALKQRNQLLRQQKFETIAVWEKQLAQAAVYLWQQRLLALEELTTLALEPHTRIARSEIPLTTSYRYSSAENADLATFLAFCERNRQREARAGHTLIGPHRDDFDVLLDQRPARLFASEGQKMSCAIAFRLAEWRRLAKLTPEPPLLILDDALTPLDPERRKALFEQLHMQGQVFIASPSALREMATCAQSVCFRVQDGSVQKEERQEFLEHLEAPQEDAVLR